MRVNKKGQTVFMSVMFGIMIFIAGVMIVNFVELETDSLLGTTGLNCDNSNITDGTKLTCLVGELVVPYFILIFLSAVGGIIASKVLI